MDLIDKKIEQRAQNAFRFLPFNRRFYNDLINSGLDCQLVFKNREKYCLEGYKWFKNPESVEHSFRWLIKLGILRREVDGQGLTSRIRLTPFARQMIQINPYLPTKKNKFFIKIICCLSLKFQL